MQLISHARIYDQIDVFHMFSNDLFSASLYHRTIGMFEQNNVGVQMKMPLAEYVERMITPGAAVDPVDSAHMLDATKRIVDNIDGVFRIDVFCHLFLFVTAREIVFTPPAFF